MALLDWTEEFALGEAQMDATHREFVDCLNAVAAAADDNFLPALDRFIDHSDAHFADENTRMAATCFPPSQCHVTEHTNVLNLCRDVRQMVVEGKLPVGRVLVNELAPWFQQHAQSMDAMLAYWLNLDDAGRAQAKQLAAERQALMQTQRVLAEANAGDGSGGTVSEPLAGGCGAMCSHDGHEHADHDHAQHDHGAAERSSA